MKKMIIKRKNGKENEVYLFNIRTDKCPLCDTLLKDTYGSWNMFHGEINRNCCNSSWQIKDFCPPDGEEENYKEFFKELNKPEYHSISVDKDLWEHIREAFKEIGVNDCKNKDVYNILIKKHII